MWCRLLGGRHARQCFHREPRFFDGAIQPACRAPAAVRILLADEPTGNLDTSTSEEILDLMVKLNEERDLTIMMVTHEPETAAFASRVLVFVDGKIVQDGPPEEVLK